jgi:predicted phage terminase large subunit-like protein
VLVAAPPGSAKSTYGSILFPAWYLSQHPDHQIICASHTVELAEKHARQARNLIMEHSTVLGIELADDSQSAGRWSLKSGGSVFAVGSGGAAVGRRADVICIDDPLRGTEDAHSESARDKLYDWFVSDLLTRLRPGGKIVLISTIWHEDDLFSRLAATGRYEVIRLPAVAESDDDCLGRSRGQYLWDSDPEYPYGEFLRVQRENQLPSNWSALFQCRPAPETGSYFLDTYFRPYTTLPWRESMHIYGASDYAVSAGKGDYTVHVVVGQSGDQLYLLDCWRNQADTAESIEAFCDLVLKWKPLGWAQEAGQINSSIGPFMRVRQRQRNAWVPAETFPTRGDKSVRCQSIRGRLALNNGLLVPTQAEWWPAVRSELLAFPHHVHDDAADAIGLIGQILDRMSSPHVPVPKPPNKVLSTDPALCTVTLEDMFSANESRSRKQGSSRIR